MLDELSEHGRPRLQHVREYLATRGPDYVPAQSSLELRALNVLREHGITTLRAQANLGDEDDLIGRVDLHEAAICFVLEIQSDLFHTSQLDRRNDANRIAKLEAAGTA